MKDGIQHDILMMTLSNCVETYVVNLLHTNVFVGGEI